jgi:ribose transport system substrate-binding protein
MASRSPAQARTLTVAFVPKALNSPFWAEMQQAAEREVAAQGVRLVSLAAERETDVERQYQIIENLIQQKVDAILLAPAGSKELVPAIRKANDAGIPVLILDTRIDRAAADSMGVRVLTYIGSDNFEGGAVAGRYLARTLGGTGSVAIIEGISGHETADQRRQGFLKGVEGHPGIRVVASQTADWERARAYTVAENLLQAHRELDAIFAANDEMALGALEAVAAARRLDRVRIVGFDAIPDALANIASGRLLGSVAQFPGEMGRLGVHHAVILLREGKAPPPEVLTRVEMIDRSNIAAFVKRGAESARAKDNP